MLLRARPPHSGLGFSVGRPLIESHQEPLSQSRSYLMSAESRAANARIKKSLREHKSVLRRQRQSHRPDGLVAMADDWDRALVTTLRRQPEHEFPWSCLVNAALKGCNPRCRADREMVKRDIIHRITVLRRAGILGYRRRTMVRLLIHDPPLVFKSVGPAILPEPNLDYGH